MVAQLFPEAADFILDTKKPEPTGGVRSAESVSGGLELVVDAAWGQAQRVIISNLSPAYHTLSIDGGKVLSATHEEWAKGVLVPLPERADVQKLMAAVVDKNNQFFYSWKALNQVHIVGERKKSNSGRALPEELVEFQNLTTQREAQLKEVYPEHRTQTWRLLADPERKLP
jgi:hypothetical protein